MTFATVVLLPGLTQSAPMVPDAPCHAHIYYTPAERELASVLRDELGEMGEVRFVGAMTDRPVGPHPVAQFEVHFLGKHWASIVAAIETTGLRALIHPLTDDDLADHTTLGHWIGEPLQLDLSVLDPPGANKGVARFGVSDF